MTRSVVGALALGALMVVYAEALQRWRSAGGYARDGINMAATLVLTGAFRLAGFPGAVALLAGLLTTLAIYCLDWIVARGLKVQPPRLLLIPVLLAWAGLVGTLPDRVAAILGTWVTRALP